MGNGECSGRVAAVTGAGSGIGLAIARRLQQQGYRVYNLSRHPGQGKGLSFLYCDVTREEQVQAAFSAIWQQQGRLDVLVCNAGMGVSGAVEFIPEEDRRDQMEVNEAGAFRCARQAAVFMREQGRGKILFISSLAAVFPIPFQAYYAAGKAALMVFSDALGMELAPFSVQCGCLLLGDVKTGFTAARRKNETGDDRYGGRIRRSVEKMEKDERSGMSPEKVARTAVRCLGRRRLPPRKPVGVSCSVLCALNRVLPHRAVLFLLHRLYAS